MWPTAAHCQLTDATPANSWECSQVADSEIRPRLRLFRPSQVYLDDYTHRLQSFLKERELGEQRVHPYHSEYMVMLRLERIGALLKLSRSRETP